MLEAYTTLGYLAAVTERVQLHTLVTGVVYREPGLLAKAVTTLDVLSGGRAGLGIGAAWNEDESLGLGLPFPPTAERFERLEEAIQICLQMWSDSDGAFDGQHYHLGRTLSSPPNLSAPRPRLMIGGIRRAQDASPRRPLRRRLQPLRRAGVGAQARRAPRALRDRSTRLRRDREDHDRHAMTRRRTAASFSSSCAASTSSGSRPTYLMIPGPEPLAELDAFGHDVISEISTW